MLKKSALYIFRMLKMAQLRLNGIFQQFISFVQLTRIKKTKLICNLPTLMKKNQIFNYIYSICNEGHS